MDAAGSELAGGGGGRGSRGVDWGFERYRSVKSSRPSAEIGKVE